MTEETVLNKNNWQSQELPIHFFTIVLNGKPFIDYHIEIFKQLPFNWHWHIVEGVADLKHDTAWSLPRGGRINPDIHHNGKSNDGTTKYIDEIARQYPQNITIYRQPEGVFWEGKREMVNAPLKNIQEECLLWQVDVDELWTVEQLRTAREMFIKNPHKTAAFYWCWYFVGENLVISTRNCYAQNPQQDWLRTWRYKPGYFWAAHEPPVLVENLPNGKQRNLASVNPFLHQETERMGLVFQHFAYVTSQQLEFKESYYGYQNVVLKWQELQQEKRLPVLLREYFSWVKDDTMVDTARSCGVVPILKKQENGSDWKFLCQDEIAKITVKVEKIAPRIIIDGVFFQLYRTGIARVWKSLLQEWAVNGFGQHILVLDRLRTTPKFSGIRYRDVPPYDYNRTDADRLMLQQVCDEEKADIFISTYYTTPISTPSVFMAYDMIPEVMQWNLNDAMWREKHNSIRHATAYIAISENTARDLARIFTHIPLNAINVAHCGVENTFFPSPPQEISSFTTKYRISKPYFLIVGGSGSYKNTPFFFQAFAKIPNKQDFEIVCTGASFISEHDLKTFLAGVKIHKLQLQDEELRVAYSAAVALVYPSKYEGFGLPVLEALACGCPVITCANASIPEVAGEAAIYVKDDDVEELVRALDEVQKPDIRKRLISAGLAQAKQFSWSKMADLVSSYLGETVAKVENLNQVSAQVSMQLQQIDRDLLEKPIDSPELLKLLGGSLSLYEIDPFDESVLAELRLIRQRLADFWLNTVPEELENLYLGNPGKAHQMLLNSDFKKESLTESERGFLDELLANIAKGYDARKAINYQLAATLYGDRSNLANIDRFPKWLQS